MAIARSMSLVAVVSLCLALVAVQPAEARTIRGAPSAAAAAIVSSSSASAGARHRKLFAAPPSTATKMAKVGGPVVLGGWVGLRVLGGGSTKHTASRTATHLVQHRMQEDNLLYGL